MRLLQLPALPRLTRVLRRLVFIAVGLIVSLTTLPGGSNSQLNYPLDRLFHLPAAMAQHISTEDIWQAVYQQIPSLPLENQYVNKETRRVSTNNTLVNRIIRYHIYTKGRSANYRLDWKLTLADYLGVNELMEPATYPSGTSLRINPMQGDIAAVQSLTRAQRDALVNTLVSLFNPNAQASESTPQPSPAVSPAPAPQPSIPPPPRFPHQPKPGDAELLQP